MKYSIPKEVIHIILTLQKDGFEGFIVGGAVRDMLMNRAPKDWDVATNAKPVDIQSLFPDSIYENRFGTVAVKTRGFSGSFESDNGKKTNNPVDIVEVTTYRVEKEYSDSRRPDSVEFVSTLDEDLARRDFTVNAMAMEIKSVRANTMDEEGITYNVLDPFGGQDDLANRLIRAVGEPTERFGEDALRLIRAIRFGAQLGFGIEQATYEAIVAQSKLLENISNERIRDEFIKIIESPYAGDGVRVLEKTGLLREFLPELTEGVGVGQNHHHIYTVFEHNVKSLEYAVKKNYSLTVRLASLFHDIGKPRSKRGKGDGATFYNHEMIGARMTEQIMKRMKFPNAISEKVSRLVRWHQFYYQAEEVTASSVRRLVKNVGKENVDDLLKVREADRIGSGVPKAVPYKLRHLKYMIEKVSTDPISPKMLAVNGDDLMKELGIKPGKKLGLIISSLLSEVLDNPDKNKKDILISTAMKLNGLTEDNLRKNLDRIHEAQRKQEEAIKKKHYVK